jgi:CcdB protein
MARNGAVKGPSVTILNPEFVIDDIDVIMLTQQPASAPAQILRKHVGNLETQPAPVMRALDFLFNGI